MSNIGKLTDSFKECIICSMVMVEPYQNCSSCNNPVCKACMLKNLHPIEEWLDVSIYCCICNALICTNCVQLCYDCANTGDSFDVYCKQCVPSVIKSVVCSMHTWTTCDKHEDEHARCGQCDANHMYDNRQQYY